MQFSEKEIRFLLGSPTVEMYGGEVVGGHFEDMRAKGCPEHIFNRVLESRARKAGSKFIEFRKRNNPGASTKEFETARATGGSLESEITASKLF